MASDDPNQTWAICNCNNCSGHLEFDASRAGEVVACPHCGMETTLYVPETPVSEAPPPVLLGREPQVHIAESPLTEGGAEVAQKTAEAAKIEIDAYELSLLNLEASTTPNMFQDFVGQERLKTRIGIAVIGARQRGEALCHVLLTGPAGLGKATLAGIIAKAMGVSLKSISGPAISRASDLAGLLTKLEPGDMLFIDEIHRLPRTIEEYLYLAMRDFKLDIIIDQGPDAREVRLNLPCFTVVGTAPRKDRITANLLACFPIVESMDGYTPDELYALAVRSATARNVEIEEAAARRIVNSADGTPLDVLNRVLHFRDFAQVKTSSGRITLGIVDEALKLLVPADQASELFQVQGRETIPSEVRREV